MELPQQNLKDANNSMAPNSEPRDILLGDTVWTVYEDARTMAPTYRKSLVFISSLIARRVRNYPPNWRSLSDMELVAVSERS